MADTTQGSSSFWDGYKEFWSQRFAFLGNYSKFVKRDKPVRSWSSSDVEEFIAYDPVHGPVVMILSLYNYLHLCPLMFVLIYFIVFCLIFMVYCF